MLLCISGIVPQQNEFRPLEFPLKVRLVVCGDRHTAVINHIGEVFCFGRNSEGQLGLSYEDKSQLMISTPSKVELYDELQNRREDLYFYAISAGKDHTAAVAISFPPGMCRNNSAIVSAPALIPSSVAASDASFATEPPSPMLQSSISRLGSKLSVLRTMSRPKLDSHLSLINKSFVAKPSAGLFSLPSIVTSHPTLYPFQTLKSMNSMEYTSTLDAVTSTKKTRSIGRVPIVDALRSDDAEAHLPGIQQYWDCNVY